MKIKEMEQRTGIKSANIRYYEKAGLFVPKRMKDNNYRDYCEEDVEVLERIKILRMLGISISEILRLQTGEDSLDEVMEKRLVELQKEAQSIEEVKAVCATILKKDIQMDDLNEEVLNTGDIIWRKQMEKIWKEDIDRWLLLKGTLLMLGVSGLIFATRMTYEYTGMIQMFVSESQPVQTKVIINCVAAFLVTYGCIWAVIEGHGDYPFLYCYSNRCWAAPGMGILTNSFSICGIGIGIKADSVLGFVFSFFGVLLIIFCIRCIFMIKHNRKYTNCQKINI